MPWQPHVGIPTDKRSKRLDLPPHSLLLRGGGRGYCFLSPQPPFSIDQVLWFPSMGGMLSPEKFNSSGTQSPLAVISGWMKGPAYNGAPVTKSLPYALVLVASPFLTPGPEPLSLCHAWDAVYSSQKLELFPDSQISDKSPAFCPVTDAHPCLNLRCS